MAQPALFDMIDARIGDIQSKLDYLRNHYQTEHDRLVHELSELNRLRQLVTEDTQAVVDILGLVPRLRS